MNQLIAKVRDNEMEDVYRLRSSIALRLRAVIEQTKNHPAPWIASRLQNLIQELKLALGSTTMISINLK
jgi:hypothetical protein